MSEPVGLRIRNLRRAKKVRQKTLAKIIEISPGALTNFEKGRRRISLDWLRRIADALNTSVAYFLDDSSAEFPSSDPQARRLLQAWRRLRDHPELQADFMRVIEHLGHRRPPRRGVASRDDMKK